MDMQKIGSFLKELRKEKGLTQEQFAEILGVAGRTVSRWETASNMPDLSILIQIAEFYDVEVSEILDGERKDDKMDKELKDTLTKVADYSEADRIKRAKISNTAFLVTLFVCVSTLLVQFVWFRNIQSIIGEYITLMIGAIACIIMTVKNGLWETSSNQKITTRNDMILSAVMSSVFTLICSIAIYLKFGEISKSMVFALVFFVVIFIVGFIVLQVLASLSKRAKNKK